jgi:hypothetical protein
MLFSIEFGFGEVWKERVSFYQKLYYAQTRDYNGSV